MKYESQIPLKATINERLSRMSNERTLKRLLPGFIKRFQSPEARDRVSHLYLFSDMLWKYCDSAESGPNQVNPIYSETVSDGIILKIGDNFLWSDSEQFLKSQNLNPDDPTERFNWQLLAESISTAFNENNLAFLSDLSTIIHSTEYDWYDYANNQNESAFAEMKLGTD